MSEPEYLPLKVSDHRAGEPRAVASSEPMTPSEMLTRAVERRDDPERIKQLMDLAERWEANEARKEYTAAMAAARGEFLPVIKRREGNRSKFESLTDVTDAINPALSKHGISYVWKTEMAGALVRVTCEVTHARGHRETNSLEANPKDVAAEKADMTPVQRLGGTVTYLQRYTLKAAVGIAAAYDTDGGTGKKGGAKDEPVVKDDKGAVVDLEAVRDHWLARVENTAKGEMAKLSEDLKRAQDKENWPAWLSAAIAKSFVDRQKALRDAAKTGTSEVIANV